MEWWEGDPAGNARAQASWARHVIAAAKCGCYACRRTSTIPPQITMERGPDGVWRWPSPWDVLPPFPEMFPEPARPWLMDWRIGAMVNTAVPSCVVLTGI